MIAVQFDRKDIFDRLWRWSKKYMQHQEGLLKGYLHGVVRRTARVMLRDRRLMENFIM